MTSNNKNIILSKIIASSFFDVYKSIKKGDYIHHWFKGGRGSTKSSFISIVIILGLLSDPEANAYIFLKYHNRLKKTVYNQMCWAIDILGLTHLFKFKLSPLQIIYTPTGQVINFTGLDDATKFKGEKPEKGFYKYIWFEELELFEGIEEIRKALQSIMRGNDDFKVFYSYNPPISINNWVNMQALVKSPHKILHTSNYLNVNPEWLGKAFLIEAEDLRLTNERAYRHEYMGEPVGTGGNIFQNIKSEAITDEQIKTFDRVLEGVDFGFATDPFTWIQMYYDKTRMTLYIFNELYKYQLSNAQAYDLIKPLTKTMIVADCAEPKSIDDLKTRGLNIKPAVKGADSIRFGIRFMQGLKAIVIDPVRCPKTHNELLTYEHERAKDGSFKSGYPDKNNHCSDAIRYALEQYSLNKRGWEFY